MMLAADLTSRLDALPTDMARRVAPVFDGAVIERYARYLNAMYHFAIRTETHLRVAGEAAPADDLRELFLDLAARRTSSYRLAEADLHVLGLRPTREAPVAVADLHDFLEVASQDRSFAYLGAIHALEAVAARAGPALVGRLHSLGLDGNRTRFVTELVRDARDDSPELEGLCRRCLDAHADAIIGGAERAADLWVAMHLAVRADS
jgi:hypothetical protein